MSEAGDLNGPNDSIDKLLGLPEDLLGPDAGDLSRVDVYLDDVEEPLLSYRPPVRFELDTTQLPDGHHTLRVEAFDAAGHKGIRTIKFQVRNGPGIAVHGVSDNDMLEGRVPVLINAYGGTSDALWEPSRAETPAPIPSWAWVLLIVIAAFGLFYGVQQWGPPRAMAEGGVYGPPAAGGRSGAGASGPASAAAGDPASATAAAAAGADGRGAAAQAGQPAAATLSAEDAALGESLYIANCSGCHQAGGQGLAGVFPPLAGDHLVIADDATGHIDAVLHGLQGVAIDGVPYVSPMPSFAHLSDDQLAAILNHERTSWGNAAPLVSAEEVAALR